MTSGSAPFTSGSGGGDNDGAEPIQLIHSKRGTNIYRHGNVGYKVLMCPEEDVHRTSEDTAAAPIVSEEHILKLVREQTISRYLPHGCNKRRVVDVKGFKGNPSLYFEWVEGNSLKQLMDERQVLGCARGGGGAGAQDLMAKRLRVAMSITKSLDEFHFGGVAYNFLTLDHILLRWMGNDKNDEQLCTASLINLSRAIVFAEVSEEEAKEAIRKDLNDLGLIFCALFSGESNVSSEVERRLSEDDNMLLSDLNERNDVHTCDDRQPPAPKRGKQRTLRDGLPTYLSSMISAMVNDENVDASELYDSASDVLKDLQVVAKNPRLRLVPNVKAEVRESLVMPKTFYGRRNEVNLLTRSLQTVAILGKPSIAVISGRGGVGKTSLINQIKKPLEDINGRFIQVKFDLNTQPDTVLFSALDSFMDGISDDEEGMELKQLIKESLGSEITVVANSIPSVEKMIDNYEISSKSVTRAEDQQQEQMISALCKLIGSIATRKNPIVLFLDDLHWADKSLDVVQRIFVSPDIKHCFFLACYRDNDFTLAKSVETMLDGIQSQEDMSIIKVPLGGLEIEFTHELISESLCLPPNLKSVKQLANVVHHKTGGLIFFMKSFLYELCDEGLLCFNLNQRWQFNFDPIMQKEISGNVVQHLKHRMARLAKSRYLLGLRIASCLGSSFSVNTFQRATDMKVNLEGFVQFVQSNGFILCINQTAMHWVHDSVQQAAYKTISRSKIESFHLLIASRLLVRTPQDDLDECVFDIVRHMNEGITLIKTPDQKYDGAQLNLRAGQKAMSSCSFHSAAKYFVCGIKILGDESWGDNYDLMLALHRMAGKSLLVIGDERINTVVANILANASCFEDEVLAHIFQMRYLTSLGQSDEVICLGKDLLQKLDEPLPTEVSKNAIIQEFLRTKAKLKAFTEEDLLALPHMTDKKKSTAMLILSYTVDAAILCQPFLIPLLSFRLMNLTLDHGVSSFSASCFSTYGCWLVNNLISDFEEGYRMGQVATKLMNRGGDEYMNARVFVSVYGLINVWRQPFQACLDMLLEGYEVGMRQGDIENAFSCLAMYGQMTMSCGSSLREMVDCFRIYCKNAIMFKKHVYAHSLVGQLQLALSLIGSSEDSYQTFFKTSKEDSEHGCIQSSIESDGGGYKNHFRLIPFRNKLFFFLMDGPDEEIRKWHLMSQKVDETSTQIIFPRRIYGFFIDGMIGFSFARKYEDERGVWEKNGDSMISKFQKWKESSEWNFANKLYLLLAERFFLQDDQEKAFEYYDKASKAACDHRFLHEEGLANVAAAKCCLHYGKKKEALIRYANAKDCYQRWGATALVKMIENRCSNL